MHGLMSLKLYINNTTSKILISYHHSFWRWQGKLRNIWHLAAGNCTKDLTKNPLDGNRTAPMPAETTKFWEDVHRNLCIEGDVHCNLCKVNPPPPTSMVLGWGDQGHYYSASCGCFVFYQFNGSLLHMLPMFFCHQLN